MNFLYITLLVIIILLLIGFVFKIIKSVIKVVIFLAIIINILILVLGSMVYFDTKDFQNNFLGQSKKFLLVQDDRLAAGFSTTDFSDVNYYEEDNLKLYSQLINERNFEQLRGNDYKVFIMDMVSFEGALESNVSITDVGIILNRTEMNLLLGSENTRETLSMILYDGLAPEIKNDVSFTAFNQSMTEKLSTDANLRGILFTALFSRSLKDNYLSFLISGIRSKTITVYPETLMFSTIKYIPDFFITAALTNTVNNTAQEHGNA
ncbi:MAG: hypothetical protein V1743_07765 [Nanoarchaeota archaeon]